MQNELRRQNEKEAQYLAAALEVCVSGFLNVFNRRTNTIRSNADRIPGTDAREAEKGKEQERRRPLLFSSVRRMRSRRMKSCDQRAWDSSQQAAGRRVYRHAHCLPICKVGTALPCLPNCTTCSLEP